LNSLLTCWVIGYSDFEQSIACQIAISLAKWPRIFLWGDFLAAIVIVCPAQSWVGTLLRWFKSSADIRGTSPGTDVSSP